MLYDWYSRQELIGEDKHFTTNYIYILQKFICQFENSYQLLIIKLTLPNDAFKLAKLSSVNVIYFQATAKNVSRSFIKTIYGSVRPFIMSSDLWWGISLSDCM